MKFPKVQISGIFPSICTSSDSSISPSGSPSFTLPPSAENLLKIPGNHGEKNAVSYMHEIPLKIPTVHTSSMASVIAPISTSSVPSVHLSHGKCQEIPEEFPGTNYGEKFLVEIMAKIPDDATLALHNAKFPEKTPGNYNGGKCSEDSCQYKNG